MKNANDNRNLINRREGVMESGLQQIDVGKRNYGFIVGPGGYIVTENDFCHQVRPLHEPTDLRDNWSFEGEPLYRRVTLAEMRANAKPIGSYRKWAHYWGIKSRVAANYSELLRSMREIGAATETMPKWGDEVKAA